jgi:hypothetical protein
MQCLVRRNEDPARAAVPTDGLLQDQSAVNRYDERSATNAVSSSDS